LPSFHGKRRRSEWVTLQDLANSRYEVARDPMFEDVSQSSRHNCCCHESIILVHREENQLSSRTQSFESMGSLNSAYDRHGYVKYNQVGVPI
jgi:hypothetical protein